jgi:hypothetical protein
MITTAAKWFLGLSLVSFVLAVLYGYSTGGTRLGPLTAGYYGGVGDHLGYTILVTTAVAALLLGVVAVATRDADAAALAEVVGADDAPAAVAPAYPSMWPTVGAFGVAMVVLGLVISNVLFMVGAFVLVAVVIEWMVLDWSDHATGDAETNHYVRRRMMAPFEVPLAGFLLAAGAVLAFSRILLTSSELGAVAVAIALGVAVLSIGALIALRPTLSHDLVVGILAVVALGVIVAGVVSANRGERFVEPHHEEEGVPGEQTEPNQPYEAEGTEANTTTTVAEGEG